MRRASITGRPRKTAGARTATRAHRRRRLVRRPLRVELRARAGAIARPAVGEQCSLRGRGEGRGRQRQDRGGGTQRGAAALVVATFALVLVAAAGGVARASRRRRSRAVRRNRPCRARPPGVAAGALHGRGRSSPRASRWGTARCKRHPRPARPPSRSQRCGRRTCSVFAVQPHDACVRGSGACSSAAVTWAARAPATAAAKVRRLSVASGWCRARSAAADGVVRAS